MLREYKNRCEFVIFLLYMGGVRFKKIFVFLIVQVFFIYLLHRLITVSDSIYTYDEIAQHANYAQTYWFIKETKFDGLGNYLINIFSHIRFSIENNDYNLVSVFPLAVINSFLNLKIESREIFIFLIYFVYIIPSFWVMYLLVKEIGKKKEENWLSFLVFNLIFFFNPITIISLTRGQSTDDVILITLLINLFLIRYKKTKNEIRKINNLLLMGFGLSYLSTSHRWANFYSLSFFLTFFIVGVISYLKDKNVKEFLGHIRDCVLLSVVFVVSFFAISGSLWKRLLSTNIAEINDVFKFSNGLLDSFNRTFSIIGYFYVIFWAVTVWYGIKKKINYVWYFVLNFFLTIILFLQIQDFELYQFAIVFVSLFCPILCWVYQTNNKKNLGLVILGMILLIGYKTTPMNKIFGLADNQEYYFDYGNREVVESVAEYLITKKDVNKLYFVSSGSLDINMATFEYYTCILEGKKYSKLCDVIYRPEFVSKYNEYPEGFTEAKYVITDGWAADFPIPKIFLNYVKENYTEDFKMKMKSRNISVFVKNKEVETTTSAKLKDDFYLMKNKLLDIKKN